MPLIISPPASAFNGDITQRILGSIQKKETSLAAQTAIDILDADTSAILGRKLLSISNNSSETVFIAVGETATLSNYDYPLYPNRQLLDIEHNAERISAIAAGAASVRIKFAKYIEV